MFDDGYFLLRDMRRAGLDIDVHAKVNSKGRKLSSEEERNDTESSTLTFNSFPE